jgi:hypothetical protein
MKHKHSETIKAFVDGIECQYFDSLTDHWEKIEDLEDFTVFNTVRIKPEPDVLRYMYIKKDKEKFIASVLSQHPFSCDNLVLIFDRETDKLKDAKVIK